MTDDKNDISVASDSFKKIRDYLEGGYKHRKVSIGLLATAIENKDIGIYTWDRFGRFVKADSTKSQEILNYLADLHQSEYDFDGLFDDNEFLTLFEGTRERLINPSLYFGWPIDKIPDFEKLPKQDIAAYPVNPRAQEIAGATKKHNTYLVIIGALCSNFGFDYKKRGASAKIKMFLELIGTTRDDGTILTALTEVHNAVELERAK